MLLTWGTMGMAWFVISWLCFLGAVVSGGSAKPWQITRNLLIVAAVSGFMCQGWLVILLLSKIMTLMGNSV